MQEHYISTRTSLLERDMDIWTFQQGEAVNARPWTVRMRYLGV